MLSDTILVEYQGKKYVFLDAAESDERWEALCDSPEVACISIDEVTILTVDGNPNEIQVIMNWLFETETYRIVEGLMPAQVDLLARRIDSRDEPRELHASMRLIRVSRGFGVQYWYQIAERSIPELRKSKWFGLQSIREIEEILATVGLAPGIREAIDAIRGQLPLPE